MNYLIVGGYLIAAVINLAPVVGVLSNARLLGLYGLPIESADLSLLLRHRAVLFGIVGLGLVAGAVLPALRTATGIAGLISMLSFVMLYWLIPGVSGGMTKIVVADLVGIAALLTAMALHLRYQ